MRFLTLVMILSWAGVALGACGGGPNSEVAGEPTATLQPIVSHTPRFTATPVPSRTPLPTFTPVPSETPIPPTPSLTFTPSPTPPIIGIVQSLQLVNVRDGPGTNFSAFEAIAPGTGVTIIGQNADGTWYNIRLEDGNEGWVSARLIFIRDTPTPIPTATPSPDLTALFLGTPLPTAILGGGTITPTPPGAIRTATPADLQAAGGTTAAPTNTSAPFIPVVDIAAINLTATQLAFGIATPTPEPTANASPTLNVLEAQVVTPDPSAASPTMSITPPPASGSARVRQGARVFALCDNPALGGDPPPTDLAAGSTIVVWWSWFARTEDQIRQHLENATYEVRVDGDLLTRLTVYRSGITKPGNDYVVSWTVPYEKPLEAGVHTITYRVTWTQTISDGYRNYGPNTNNPVEEGSCTFTVR